jgi:hypothetical protein
MKINLIIPSILILMLTLKSSTITMAIPYELTTATIAMSPKENDDIKINVIDGTSVSVSAAATATTERTLLASTRQRSRANTTQPSLSHMAPNATKARVDLDKVDHRDGDGDGGDGGGVIGEVRRPLQPSTPIKKHSKSPPHIDPSQHNDNDNDHDDDDDDDEESDADTKDGVGHPSLNHHHGGRIRRKSNSWRTWSMVFICLIFITIAARR